MTSQREKGVSSDWLRGYKGQEKNEMEALVRNSTIILEKLKEILEIKLQQITEAETKESQYSEGWPYLQAHRNGKRQALGDLLSLVQHLK